MPVASLPLQSPTPVFLFKIPRQSPAPRRHAPSPATPPPLLPFLSRSQSRRQWQQPSSPSWISAAAAAFISWLPMYNEAKVAFLVYLWYPRTKGTTYVYETFFKPYVAKHETEIDRTLLDLRTRAGDMLVIYSQRVASYGQSRFYEILQYIASQSPSESPKTRAAQILECMENQFK